MLPILLNIGPVKIYSYGLFLSLGLIVGLYYFWKMGRDEHLEEISLFDGFFISLLSYFVLGRLVYVLLNLPKINGLISAFALLSHPGLIVFAGAVGSLLILLLVAKAKNWEIWKTLDMAAVTYSVITLFGSIGSLLNGTNVGKYVNWTIDSYSVVMSLLLFVVIYRVRKNFRFYSWYKGENSVANEGLAALAYTLLLGIYYFGRFFLENTHYYGMLSMGAILIAVSTLAIYLRSGRKIRFFSVQLKGKRR